MPQSATVPGYLTPKQFALYVIDAHVWVWGTAQGAFNEKQTLTQIIVDAVIGMIPVVGDVTAVRDLIAVSIGLATDAKKRDSTLEWVLLVILIFALIPVIGGVIKGVGRIALNVTDAVAKNPTALAAIAQSVIQFLNRVGHKNAEAWFRSLNVLEYQGAILYKFRGFCDLFIVTIVRYTLRFGAALPDGLLARMEQLSDAFKSLRKLGDQMIPSALEELHRKLQLLQEYIHAGGGVAPPSDASIRLAQSGQRTITYAEEARLIESGNVKTVIRAGEFPQNLASTASEAASGISKVYRHEPGYPDLLRIRDAHNSYYPAIAAASGKIRNEKLSDVTLFRAFGDLRVSKGIDVDESYAIGGFWGVGKVPGSADAWRGPCAVLDEWNGNGWLSMLHIPKNVQLPACTSIVAEQFGQKIAGQFLPGGSKQAVIPPMEDPNIRTIATGLAKAGGGKVTLPSGIVFEIRPSGWTSANEVIGYGNTVVPHASVVERLGATERQVKGVQLVSAGALKNERREQI